MSFCGLLVANDDGYLVLNDTAPVYYLLKKTLVTNCSVLTSSGTFYASDGASSPANLRSLRGRKYVYTTTNSKAIIAFGGLSGAWKQFVTAAQNGNIKYQTTSGSLTNYTKGTGIPVIISAPVCFTADSAGTKGRVEFWMRSLNDSSDSFNYTGFYIYEFVPITQASSATVGLQLRNGNNQVIFDSGYAEKLMSLAKFQAVTAGATTWNESAGIAYSMPLGVPTTTSATISVSSQYWVEFMTTMFTTSDTYYLGIQLVSLSNYKSASAKDYWLQQYGMPTLIVDVTNL